MPDAWVEALLRDDHDLGAILVEAARVVRANAAARALAPAASAGAPVHALVEPESRDKLERALASPGVSCEVQLAGEGAPPVAARLLALADGERRVLLATAPRARADELAIVLGANDDLAKVTRELAKRAAELEQARGELERLGAIRDGLTATLSHDLGGFLSSISLTAGVLARGRHDEAATRRHAVTIRRNVDRMAGLLGNLLDAVRLDQGGVTLHRQRSSLAALARGTVESLEPVAAAAGVRVEVSAAEEAVAEVDPVRFGQVLSNLVSNAIRHSPEGGLVRIEVQAAGSALRVAVSDDGPGVPRELRATLFDRFRQGSRPGAAGLGLFIARQLVELHGGALSLEDDGGPGARFVAELPREA